MKKAVILGIACSILGVLLFGFVTAAMCPARGGPNWDVLIEKAMPRIAYASAATGIVVGFGLGLIVLGLLAKK
ncbi:MAG: hypothetical protein ACLQVA_18025 [Candidatus Brocadiia bacterium]